MASRKEIELKNPWVLDIRERFNKMADQVGSVEKLKEFYAKFGFSEIPYDGIRRWGMDSSTETSDISYDDIVEGNELWMRKYTKSGFRFILIRVTHKYGGIIFFETVGEKKNKKSYIETGGNDYEWDGDHSARYKLPKHIFYPIEVIKQSWVDISSWNAPSNVIVTVKN